MEFSQIALGAALLVVVGLPVLAVRGGVPEDQAEEVAQARRAVYASAAFSLLLAIHAGLRRFSMAGHTASTAWLAGQLSRPRIRVGACRSRGWSGRSLVDLPGRGATGLGGEPGIARLDAPGGRRDQELSPDGWYRGDR